MLLTNLKKLVENLKVEDYLGKNGHKRAGRSENSKIMAVTFSKIRNLQGKTPRKNVVELEFCCQWACRYKMFNAQKTNSTAH